MPRNVRWIVTAAAVGAAMLATSACSRPAGGPAASGTQPAAPGQAQQPPAGQAQQTPAAAATPKYGGQVIMGQRDTPANLNILENARAQTVVLSHYYEPLVVFDQRTDFRIDFPLLPWLAEKWEQVDETTWLFTVRSGVKWHDGTPLTAEAVAWALDYVRDPANLYPNRSYLSSVDTIAAEDGNKVRIKLKTATPSLLVNLRNVYIVPKQIVDAGGKEALAAKGIGTGPFSLVSYDRTSKTVFKKFADYWRKDDAGRQQPYLDGLQFTHNMDMSTQQAAFAAKQIDIQQFSDKAEYDAFSKRVPDIKADRWQYSGDPGLIVNQKRPYLDKLEVRQALNLIIDRAELNENFASGLALMSLPGIPAMKTGYAYPQEELLKRPGWRANKSADIAEAKKLLQQAGVPADWELKVINYQTFTAAPQTEQVVNQFKRAGLKVQFAPMDDSSVLKEYRAGTFDLGLNVLGNAEPSAAYNNFHSKGGSNYGGINDPQIDSLTEKLRQTGDREELKRLSRQFHERMLDQTYTLGMVAAPYYTVTQPWVNDFFHTRSAQPEFAMTAPFLWVDTDKLPAARK